MPLTPAEEGQLAEIEGAENQEAGMVLDDLASQVPESSEPFPATMVVMATKAMESAIKVLSGGRPIPLPPVEEPQDGATQLPSGLYVGLRILAEFLAQSGAPPEIAIDATAAASSPAELERTTDQLMMIAREPGAKESAMQRKPAPAPAPPAPPKPGERAGAAVLKQPALQAKPTPAGEKKKRKPGEAAAAAVRGY
jgi:hypothetical protein